MSYDSSEHYLSISRATGVPQRPRPARVVSLIIESRSTSKKTVLGKSLPKSFQKWTLVNNCRKGTGLGPKARLKHCRKCEGLSNSVGAKEKWNAKVGPRGSICISSLCRCISLEFYFSDRAFGNWDEYLIFNVTVVSSYFWYVVAIGSWTCR
jgi:hypothetical protein